MGKSKMSSVDFVSTVLRDHIAPAGSAECVKGRIRLAARKLGWPHSQVRDAWYADPRISISSDEMREIEEIAGVRYGKERSRLAQASLARGREILGLSDEDLSRVLARGLGLEFGLEDSA